MRNTRINSKNNIEKSADKKAVRTADKRWKAQIPYEKLNNLLSEYIQQLPDAQKEQFINNLRETLLSLDGFSHYCRERQHSEELICSLLKWESLQYKLANGLRDEAEYRELFDLQTRYENLVQPCMPVFERLMTQLMWFAECTDEQAYMRLEAKLRNCAAVIRADVRGSADVLNRLSAERETIDRDRIAVFSISAEDGKNKKLVYDEWSKLLSADTSELLKKISDVLYTPEGALRRFPESKRIEKLLAQCRSSKAFSEEQRTADQRDTDRLVVLTGQKKELCSRLSAVRCHWVYAHLLTALYADTAVIQDFDAAGNAEWCIRSGEHIRELIALEKVPGFELFCIHPSDAGLYAVSTDFFPGDDDCSGLYRMEDDRRKCVIHGTARG